MKMSRISAEEKEVRKLLENVEFDIDSNELKAAGDKLKQAMEIAENIGNEALIKQIWDFIQEFSYSTKPQLLELSPIEAEGLILDIGGGGSGIIGKLNGKKVIAIDKNENELLESQNEALQIVMDATDLKFLPESFDVCTAFFSLMYIPIDIHLNVFKEAHRVLKSNGRFLLWDVQIPEQLEDYKMFIVRLQVKLPFEEIETGYGVKWQRQNLEYFKDLAQKTNFKILSEWENGEIIYLELSKKD